VKRKPKKTKLSSSLHEGALAESFAGMHCASPEGKIFEQKDSNTFVHELQQKRKQT